MSVLSAEIVAAGGKHLSGGWGLLVVLLLAIGCYFLFRSMSRHLRKAREMTFDDNGPAPGKPARPPSPPAPRR